MYLYDNGGSLGAFVWDSEDDPDTLVFDAAGRVDDAVEALQRHGNRVLSVRAIVSHVARSVAAEAQRAGVLVGVDVAAFVAGHFAEITGDTLDPAEIADLSDERRARYWALRQSKAQALHSELARRGA